MYQSKMHILIMRNNVWVSPEDITVNQSPCCRGPEVGEAQVDYTGAPSQIDGSPVLEDGWDVEGLHKVGLSQGPRGTSDLSGVPSIGGETGLELHWR